MRVGVLCQPQQKKALGAHRLYILRDENAALRNRMEIYKYRKRGYIDVVESQLSRLPKGSPIYRKRMGLED